MKSVNIFILDSHPPPFAFDVSANDLISTESSTDFARSESCFFNIKCNFLNLILVLVY